MLKEILDSIDSLENIGSFLDMVDAWKAGDLEAWRMGQGGSDPRLFTFFGWEHV
jgi:hypothetical protein